MEQYLKYTKDQLKLADVILLVCDVTDVNPLIAISKKWFIII